VSAPRITLAEPGALAGFPWGRPPARLVRVCRQARGTWWFSSTGSGRFDLDPPEGTCYLATDSYAAIREASRLGPVSPDWVAEREIRSATPPDPEARLAAVTRQDAGRFGVTQELFSMVPYDLPRRWATAFRAHAFAGIRHPLRHDPRSRPAGVSLFGPAGQGSAPDGRRERLERNAVEGAGVRVWDLPHSAVLTILP
jgi:hypothetical protein